MEGLTDWVSIKYRDENIILEKSLDPEYDYINKINKWIANGRRT
jgi:hypothetical protein